MKAKEWAKANGFPTISIGKGRMPNDARAAVEAAVARGVSIEGYAVKSVKSNKPTVERVKVTGQTAADVPDEARSENLWQAFTIEQEIGMRTVDNGCGSSLTYCHCQFPKVFLANGSEAVVVFKPRKSPETFRNRWW